MFEELLVASQFFEYSRGFGGPGRREGRTITNQFKSKCMRWLTWNTAYFKIKADAVRETGAGAIDEKWFCSEHEIPCHSFFFEIKGVEASKEGISTSKDSLGIRTDLSCSVNRQNSVALDPWLLLE